MPPFINPISKFINNICTEFIEVGRGRRSADTLIRNTVWTHFKHPQSFLLRSVRHTSNSISKIDLLTTSFLAVSCGCSLIVDGKISAVLTWNKLTPKMVMLLFIAGLDVKIYAFIFVYIFFPCSGEGRLFGDVFCSSVSPDWKNHNREPTVHRTKKN